MEERRNPIVSGSLIALALVVAYVLSIGPAYRLTSHAISHPGDPLLAIRSNVYAPVWVVASKTNTSDYLRAYVAWWDPFR